MKSIQLSPLIRKQCSVDAPKAVASTSTTVSHTSSAQNRQEVDAAISNEEGCGRTPALIRSATQQNDAASSNETAKSRRLNVSYGSTCSVDAPKAVASTSTAVSHTSSAQNREQINAAISNTSHVEARQ